MKKKIFVLVFLIAFSLPILALAQTPCVKQPNVPAKPSDLPLCINQIYIWSLGVAALLAFLMMIVGGYYYMTAAGNAEKSSKGSEMLWSSVIGLALLFGAYILLNTINPDLVNFGAFNKDFSCTDSANKNTEQCKQYYQEIRK